MIVVLFFLSLFGVNKAIRKGIEAVDDSIFNLRTFLYNAKHYFKREAYLNDENVKQEHNIKSVLIHQDESIVEEEKEEFVFGELNDQVSMEKNEKENINSEVTENNNRNLNSTENENNINDYNESKEDIKQNINNDEVLKKENYQTPEINEDNQTETPQPEVSHEKPIERHDINQQTPIERENKQPEENDPEVNNQNEDNLTRQLIEGNPLSREYSYIKSIILQIKSSIDVKPEKVVKGFQMLFASFRNVDAGKNGNYWEIKGKEANFTFQFEPNLIGGIQLYKTERPCEIKYFQVLDTQRDFILIDKSELTNPIQNYEFSTLIQTNLLKLRVLENEGDSQLTCLYNYSLLAV